jgi:hypothetical protein
MPVPWEPISDFGQTDRHGFNHSSDQQNNLTDLSIPVLSLVASIFSLLAAFVAVVLYARKVFILKVYPRSAVLDVLWWRLLVSLPVSLNYAVSAVLQLGNQLEVFCPASLAIMELFWVPQLMLQGTFFVFIALVASGRRLPLRWASRATAIALCGGLVITIVVFAILSRIPGGITHQTSLAWCWIPQEDEVPCDTVGSGSSDDTTNSARCGDQHNSSVLTGLRLLGGMIWIFVSDFVGVISFVYFAYRLRRYVKVGLLAEVKPAVKLRFLYFFYYLVGTIVLVLQRLVLPQAWDSVMNRVEAFLQPSFPAFDAMVLLCSEREWLLVCGYSSSRRALLRHSAELGLDLDCVDREDADEGHPHINSASTFNYGTRSHLNPKALASTAGSEVTNGEDQRFHSESGGQLKRSGAGPPLGPAGSIKGTENGRPFPDSNSCFLGFEQPAGDGLSSSDWELNE